MNELIMKFAEQSEGDTICECGTTGFNYKKFAELIVKECIGVIEESEGYSRYFPHVVENIEKHFGVDHE